MSEEPPTPAADTSTLPLSKKERVGEEIKVARDEFLRITDEEKKRVTRLALLENERILNERRVQNTVKTCPICLEEIPAIHSCEERDRKEMVMLCCNVTHCFKCSSKSLQDISKNTKCYNCREPVRTMTYWAKVIKKKDKRHWIINALANSYMNGLDGLEKNELKGYKLLRQAADLGNGPAQDEMARLLCNGSYGPQDLKQAMYYAQKATEQGFSNAQGIWGAVLLSQKKEPESTFLLLSLSAYQGCSEARLLLGTHYETKFKDEMQVTYLEITEECKRYLLLSLYWFCKAAETEDIKPDGSPSLSKLIFAFNTTMETLWHPRSREEYPDSYAGYSHLPFCIWARKRGVKPYHPNIRSFAKPDLDLWKNVCANCKVESQPNESFKSCSRCKAFQYCSKKCQVEHWKEGHKVDCKGHWIEEFFPDIRKTHA